MKHKRHIFLALAVFAMMTACKTKEDLNPTDLSVTPDLKEIQFNADGSRTDGEAENAYLFFVVTNQIDWNVTSDQTWCKTSKQGSQLRISADVNTSSDVPPAATITVTTAGEEHKITIVATQAAATAVPEQPEQPPVSPTLTLSPNLDAMEFDVNGVSATSNGSVIVPRFTVATNQLTWDATSNQIWCRVSKLDDRQFIVTAAPNISANAPLPATVTVTAGTAQQIIITVTQQAKAPAGNSATCLNGNVLTITDLDIPANIQIDEIRVVVPKYTEAGVLMIASAPFSNGRADITLPTLDRYISTGWWGSIPVSDQTAKSANIYIYAFWKEQQTGTITRKEGNGSAGMPAEIIYFYVDKPYTINYTDDENNYSLSFSAGWNAYELIKAAGGGEKWQYKSDITAGKVFKWKFVQ